MKIKSRLVPSLPGILIGLAIVLLGIPVAYNGAHPCSGFVFEGLMFLLGLASFAGFVFLFASGKVGLSNRLARLSLSLVISAGTSAVVLFLLGLLIVSQQSGIFGCVGPVFLR